ncbi:BamA/TamA family outer membrane protein [Alteromonas sp. 345S023]|uniref:Translocation and assembly module subunit TamA n=1 Tax=Alteromonas profundi TaxID=2696062 RepID=A0A7X5LK49_9ALTE|nr:autotransporter assembly complex family protein [Alteromonas profundi]NDV90818.1 BamA/TamA family outer membrane protein [Alteromonas profundi]
MPPLFFLLLHLKQLVRFSALLRWQARGLKTLLTVGLLSVLSISQAYAVSYTIKGVKQDKLKNNIRIHLANLDVDTELLFDPFWQDEVKSTVATAVEPFGYYNSEATVTVEDDNVVVSVTLHSPLIVANITREIIGAGRSDPNFRQKFNAFPLKKGDVLIQPEYSSFKSSMFNYALAHGYFDFHWQATRLDLVREEDEANILLIAQSGPQYNFGKLKFVGEDKARSIIARLTPFEEGEPYSSAKLTDFNRRLNQSGYFNRVIARPVVSEAEGLNVPIEVALSHRPTDTYNVSLGAATDTGPRVRLGWERPWVNDKGHSISADLFVSEPEQSLTADYRIPMRNITRDYVSFEAGYQFIEYPNTSIESETLSLSTHRYWQYDESPWQHDFSLTYLKETYDDGDASEATTSLIMPGYSLTFLEKDDELNVQNGQYFHVSTQLGRDNFGSDINIVKSVLEGALIHTFADKHRVTVRGELGAIKTNDFSQVPTSIRFYAGGDQSIRGFQYRDISPKASVIDPDTGESEIESVGGKYLTTASVEYAYRVADNWRIAGFTDAGTATNDTSTTLTYSVGSGFHWLSPIGPVRVYVARGFAPDETTWRLHLILGPEL